MPIQQSEPDSCVPTNGSYDEAVPESFEPHVNDVQKQDTNIAIPKRVDNWDEYFWCMARAASIKSKDPRCCVGAVIVSQDNVVLSTGFNGLPRKVYDDKQILENVEEKLKVICHAEQNAILNAARIGVAIKGTSIYVTKFPCLACCNAIVQAGITRIYTRDTWYWDEDPFDGKKDGNHWRKRSLLRQTHIIIDAPAHPEYMTKKPVASVKASRRHKLPQGVGQ